MCARRGGRVTALTVTVLSPVTGHSFEVRAFCSIAHGRAACNINRPDRALHAHWQQRQARRLRDSAPTSTRNVLPAALNRVTTTGKVGLCTCQWQLTSPPRAKMHRLGCGMPSRVSYGWSRDQP
jgi:hypothetical protein